MKAIFVFGNEKIGRRFMLDNLKLRSLSLINGRAQGSFREVTLAGSAEFIIRLMDGSRISSTDLRLREEPLMSEDSLRFSFESYVYFGMPIDVTVTYSLRTDSPVMEKEIHIALPPELADKVIFESIDYENCPVRENRLTWHVPRQEAVAEMNRFNALYMELGQPVYREGFFFGMTFPLTHNTIANGVLFVRSFLGKSFSELNLSHRSVIGAAADPRIRFVQNEFYEYIERIALPSRLRLHFNPRYENSEVISAAGLEKLFLNMQKSFSNYAGVELDSYVIPDGWADYSSFWDFNEKFPDGFKTLCEKLDAVHARLGLWISPRGGFRGKQQELANWLETEAHPGLGSKNLCSNDVNCGDFRYIRNMGKLLRHYLKDYRLNSLHFDGLLLTPSLPTVDRSAYITGGPQGLYGMAAAHEAWIKLFTDLRKAAPEELWITLGAFVNPSPWYLQYVNAIWLQCSEDSGFDTRGGRAITQMLCYRDEAYHNFSFKRQMQLPFRAIFNHDPVVAEAALEGLPSPTLDMTPEEFYHYLCFISVRGNKLWEFFLSPTLLTPELWQALGDALRFTLDNQELIQDSCMIGGRPAQRQVYGYASCNGEDGLIALHNPSGYGQAFEITFDIRLGAVRRGPLYSLTEVVGRRNFDKTKISYGNILRFRLNPGEISIIKFQMGELKISPTETNYPGLSQQNSRL